MDVPLSELLSAGGAIAATSVGFTGFFLNRLSSIETKFSGSIEKLTGSLVEIDKRLAVNSCIIDNFLKEECCHGHRRNKKAD